MAVYHLSAKVMQRSQGRSAVAAAAYRAAAVLHDQEAGRTYNYLAKTGVIHSRIMLPEGAPARWLDRSVLWNEVERIEQRCDAVLAREIELALPRELSQAEAIRLAHDFAQRQFVDRGMVCDLNVHWGRAADGAAQPHAHMMLSMRRVLPGPPGQPEAGAFGLKDRSWNDKALLRCWRTAWAELVNARLAEAGIDGAVDHRSNAARGIDLAPQNKIGPAGARRAVRGEDAERAAEHRAIARGNGERLLAEPGLAVEALTQQQSTFTRQDLARLVHRHSDGAAQFAAVMARVEASRELVRVGEDGYGRPRFSTREMIQLERRMEAAALDLSRRTTHPVAEDRRRALLAGTDLGAEQRLAFGHVTRARDLTVVTGYAGTGKSTMLDVARRAWEAQGFTVRGAALSGIAAEGLEGGSAIASRTIASWEYAWAQGKEALGPGDVLVLDEAGMIGSRQMGRLLAAVHKAGAKIVLVGDAEQLQAIEAGASFRAIAERVGAVAITEVRRQQAGWQQEATRELATGRTGAALDRYDQAGMVRGHATDAAAEAALIAGWQAARRQAPGESQIILAHARDDVRRLNEQARALRREAGELGADLVLQTELGLRPFAVGDRIYFLRNDRGLGVRNGSLGTVTGIAGEGGAATLTVRLDRPDPATGAAASVSFALADYAHLDHGYAATIHKAQSVTVDGAHVLATPGLDRHLAYVALSRHRHEVALHWSEESFASREQLAGRLSRERAKDTSLDYGESEAELCASYAERRGLQPRLSGAERGPARAEPAESELSVEKVRARSAQSPGLGWRNLQRVQLQQALQPVLNTLQRALEQQAAVASALAAALPRLARTIAGRDIARREQPAMAAAPGRAAPQTTVTARVMAPATVGKAGQPAPEPPVSQDYDKAHLHILDDLMPPRRRPRDHVVTNDTHRPEPALPQPEPAPSHSPQLPAPVGPMSADRFAGLALNGGPIAPPAPTTELRPTPREAGHRPASTPSSSAPPSLEDGTASTLIRMLKARIAEAAYDQAPETPMVPAVPYRPVTPEEAVALLNTLSVAPIGNPLPELLQKAYRDPAQAAARLADLVRAHGEPEAAKALRQRGPRLLGRLRGSAGMFASEHKRDERELATSAAGRLADALLQPARIRRKQIEAMREHLEAERARMSVAIPGLSPAALAVLARLKEAGAVAPDQVTRNIHGRFQDDDMAQAARVHATARAVFGGTNRQQIAQELDGFIQAAKRRLGGTMNFAEHPKVIEAWCLANVVEAGNQLCSRHAEIERERVDEQRRAAEAEAAARAAAVRQAEKGRRHQADSQYRFQGPSSGPSMG